MLIAKRRFVAIERNDFKLKQCGSSAGLSSTGLPARASL